MTHPLIISPTLARRLFITKQRLAGTPPKPNANGLLDVVRDLGCLQLDPISVVARSHLLVLWSRVGPYDLAQLDKLLWHERHLFEYWAHCASIVLTEDYPFYHPMMRSYPQSVHTREWIARNEPLKRYILREIRRHGPLPSRLLEEDGLHPKTWVSTGWTSGRNLSRMLDALWIGGKIMVAGRAGIQKLWDLTERVLPDWTPRVRLTERELVKQAAQKSLRALGVATFRHIQQHFIRGRYPGLLPSLADLEREERIERVEIKDQREAWPGSWYLHADDEPLLEQLTDDWEPRTTLLSPFDNLICDRARARQLFNYDYTIEIYTPKPKRKYGYYVLSILHGDRLIGRLDPELDREHATLRINAVYAEPGAPASAGRAIARAVEDLAAFLGAEEILYNKRVPAIWKKALLA